ncbi:MAG: lytic transglycosylase domain-containing protein [Armatimonadetes bacterium]|nr:lytic transglycosylase domain-containing protein [Armatimonadota bacterium]
MRTPFSLPLCAALLALSFVSCQNPVRAQDAYNTQKAKLKPVRFDSLEELHVAARNYIGKVIELRGSVKGTFTRGENLALLYQVGEGQNIVIDAPPAFRGQNAIRPGVASRLLCRVEGTAGSEVALTLVNATDTPESPQLFKVDDAENVAPPPNGAALPPPEQIMIGPDAPFTPSQTTPQTAKRRPSALPSRSMGSGLLRPAAPQTLRSAPSQTRRAAAPNPFFGFEDPQRAAYKALAQRSNPRLGDEMADTIAAAILSAAQAHNLDPRFLAAIVKVESSFDPYCLSSSGAMGLGQLMPFNLRPLGVANAWDPMQNLHGSAKMLRQNLNTYAGQRDGTLLAVAAYHAGVGAVNRAGKQVPQRAATQKYVWKVYYAYRALAPELF